MLVDVVKCFETLTLLQEQYWATRADFPRKFLRMVMSFSSMRCFLVQDECSSDTTETMAALTACSRFSRASGVV